MSATTHQDIIATRDPGAHITQDRIILRGKRIGPILHLAEERARLAALEWRQDRKSTRLNSSHSQQSRMPSSA